MQCTDLSALADGLTERERTAFLRDPALRRLPAVFAANPDPRARQGRRLDLPFLLTCLVAALLCNSNTLTAVGQWCRDHEAVLARLFPHQRFHTPTGALFRWLLPTLHGLAGLGLALPVVAAAALDRGWDPTHLARVLSTNPARTFGLYPRKGTLRVGSDADVVILDPPRRQPVATLPPYSSVDDSIYEGVPALYPRTVLSRGRLLAHDGTYVGPDGGGQFVPGVLREGGPVE